MEGVYVGPVQGGKENGPSAADFVAFVTICGTLPILRIFIENQKSANMAEHEKGSRPSSKSKHEKGESRRLLDAGAEKADVGRRPSRKGPPDLRGPWPPKTFKDEK